MRTVYKVSIETESGHDWDKIRQIFDGVNSPMTEPYSYNIKRSDTMKQVECNRGWAFIQGLQKPFDNGL